MKSSADSTPSVKCMICGGNTLLFQSGLFDDRHGYPGFFSIRRCEACGHGHLSPAPNVSDLEKIYTDYYPRRDLNADLIRKFAWYHGTFFHRVKSYLKGLRVNAHLHAMAGERVLDVGCGGGVSLLELKNLGAEAFGTEFDRNVEPIARELGLNIHFGGIDSLPMPDRLFDRVTLSQVFEHISDPGAFLREVRPKMSAAGQVVMAFPNIQGLLGRLSGRRWINWHVPYHLHFFTVNSLRRTLELAGFKLDSVETITPTEWFKLQLMDLVLLPAPGKPNPTWNPEAEHSSGFLLFRKAMTLMAYFFTPALRVMDFFGYGDSFLVKVSPVDAASRKT